MVRGKKLFNCSTADVAVLYYGQTGTYNWITKVGNVLCWWVFGKVQHCHWKKFTVGNSFIVHYKKTKNFIF